MKVRKETSGNFEMFDFIFSWTTSTLLLALLLVNKRCKYHIEWREEGDGLYALWLPRKKNSDSSKSDLAEKLMDSYH